MINHIKKLIKATEQLSCSYRMAYSEDGPDVGVRGYNMNHKVNDVSYQGCRDDTIIVDDIAWLIAGDIYNAFHKERIRKIHIVPDIDLDVLRVNVRAQAFVAGRIVKVDLGTRLVAERFELGGNEGVLVLKPTAY